MIATDLEGARVWVATTPVDMRKSFDSLAEVVRNFFGHDPLSGSLLLRVAGAPLDNNVCERALKKAILHRKNTMFYKTCHGAHVFMSLICTCDLCGASPFDYLTELNRHADRVVVNPRDWMPWNYRKTLERMVHAQTSRKTRRQVR